MSVIELDDDTDDVTTLNDLDEVITINNLNQLPIEPIIPSQGNRNRECPICFDVFMKIGPHRIAVTKCGHIFGKSCLLRALDTRKECPNCRKRLKIKDIVDLYDCEVVAMDNSSYERLKNELQVEKANRAKVEAENVKLQMKVQQADFELKYNKSVESKLKSEISNLKTVNSTLSSQLTQYQNNQNNHNNHNSTSSSTSSTNQITTSNSTTTANSSSSSSSSTTTSSPTSSNPSKNTTYLPTAAFQFVWSVTDLNDARIIRPYSHQRSRNLGTHLIDSLLISNKQPDNRYTLQKISIESIRYRETIGSYNAPIRDVCVSHFDDLICMTGNDKLATILSPRSGQIVTKLSLGPLIGWSCAFSESNESHIWIGGSTGMVLLFDMRKMGGRALSQHCAIDNSCLAAYQIESNKITTSSNTTTSTTTTSSSSENNPTEFIPNLILTATSQPMRINMAAPPIQSIIHSTKGRPSSSTSTTSPPPIDHLVLCQGGSCKLIQPSDSCSEALLTNIMFAEGSPTSVYDVQKCHKPSHLPSNSFSHYLVSCRSSHLSGQSIDAIAPLVPAIRRVSIYPRISNQQSQQQHVIYNSTSTTTTTTTSYSSFHKRTQWNFSAEPAITGHSLSTSATRPSSCYFNPELLNLIEPSTSELEANQSPPLSSSSHLSPTPPSSMLSPYLPPPHPYEKGIVDSSLMVACPDEERQGVAVSILGKKEVHKIELLTGHANSIRQVCLISSSDQQVKQQPQNGSNHILLGSVSANQLTLHAFVPV